MDEQMGLVAFYRQSFLKWVQLNLQEKQDIFGRVKKALIFALPNKNGVTKKLFYNITISSYYSDKLLRRM